MEMKVTGVIPYRSDKPENLYFLERDGIVKTEPIPNPHRRSRDKLYRVEIDAVMEIPAYRVHPSSVGNEIYREQHTIWCVGNHYFSCNFMHEWREVDITAVMNGDKIAIFLRTEHIAHCRRERRRRMGRDGFPCRSFPAVTVS
jgi:hypothetical protein